MAGERVPAGDSPAAAPSLSQEPAPPPPSRPPGPGVSSAVFLLDAPGDSPSRLFRLGEALRPVASRPQASRLPRSPSFSSPPSLVWDSVMTPVPRAIQGPFPASRSASSSRLQSPFCHTRSPFYRLWGLERGHVWNLLPATAGSWLQAGRSWVVPPGRGATMSAQEALLYIGPHVFLPRLLPTSPKPHLPPSACPTRFRPCRHSSQGAQDLCTQARLRGQGLSSPGAWGLGRPEAFPSGPWGPAVEVSCQLPAFRERVRAADGAGGSFAGAAVMKHHGAGGRSNASSSSHHQRPRVQHPGGGSRFLQGPVSGLCRGQLLPLAHVLSVHVSSEDTSRWLGPPST